MNQETNSQYVKGEIVRHEFRSFNRNIYAQKQSGPNRIVSHVQATPIQEYSQANNDPTANDLSYLLASELDASSHPNNSHLFYTSPLSCDINAFSTETMLYPRLIQKKKGNAVQNETPLLLDKLTFNYPASSRNAACSIFDFYTPRWIRNEGSCIILLTFA